MDIGWQFGSSLTTPSDDLNIPSSPETADPEPPSGPPAAHLGAGGSDSWTVELWAILIVGLCLIIITPILAVRGGVGGSYSSSYHPMKTEREYFESLYTESVASPSPAKLDPPMNPDRFEGLMDFWSKQIGFTWHHAPRALTDDRPFARLTTFHFPPLVDERYPLVAFPYPKEGKGGNVANFIRGMASVLNTKKDMATVPGFYVSLYDWRGRPSTRGGMLKGVLTVNEHRFANALDDAFFSDCRYSPLLNESSDVAGKTESEDFYPGAIEVMHSCYAPPDSTWPLCDDGGYWFYGVPGTGIFWNIPRASIGAAELNGANNFTVKPDMELMMAKRAHQSSTQPPPIPPTSSPTPSINQAAKGYGTLLCANKVDAMVRLYAMRARHINKLTEQFPLPDLYDNDRHLVQNNKRLRLVRQPPEIFYDPHYNPAIDDIIAGVTTYLDSRGGGESDVVALYRGVRAYQRSDPVDITAFRVMKRTNAEPMTLFWLTILLFLLFAVAVYALLVLPVTTYQTYKGQRTTRRWLIEHGCFVIGFLAFSMIFIFVITDALFRGFGYVTLDRLRRETGMSFRTIVRNAALGIEPKSNGLPMSQVFDIPMENMAINVDVDNKGDKFMRQVKKDFSFACVIMHTQPNKQGVWTCEIMDLTRTPMLKGQDTADFPAAALGLCGHPQPYEGAPPLDEQPYVFKQGLSVDLLTKSNFKKVYPIQRIGKDAWNKLPDCTCDPQVEKQVINMTDNGFGPNCIFCSGRLSESLCVASALTG
jgi:hypothetical protein